MAIPYRGNTGLGTYFITVSTAGKRSLLIKGGFFYRARKETYFIGEVWESFHDRRVRDLDEFEA
jgi:hypothetical protein